MPTANSTPNLLLWLGPYAILLLLMVFAMLEFTASLLAKAPAPRRAPLAAAEMAARLHALLPQLRPFEAVERTDCDLELRWVTGTQDATRFLRGSATSVVRLCILLDEVRHEVRVNESAYGYGVRGGLFGWIPKVTASAGYAAGPPGDNPVMRRIVAAAHKGGWSYRPIVLPMLATRRGLRLERRLTPRSLRGVSPARFWGALYVGSYCLAFVWLFALGGPALFTWRNLALVVLFSVIWWGVWALLAWMVCGFPKFWRQR